MDDIGWNIISGSRLHGRNSFFRTCLFLIISLIATSTSLYGQDSIPPVFRKNIIKINFIPLIPLIGGQSQQWVGVEYQRYINNKISVSLLTDVGVFEEYTYKKYYDFFNQNEGFSFTQKDVITRGYHLIPSVKYYALQIESRPGQGLFVGGQVDFNQYFKESELYDARTQEEIKTSSKITRMGIGANAGIHYIAFSRLSIETELSFFFRVFENYAGNEALRTPPINAFWKSDNDAFWMTVQLMIGYAFGGGKQEKNQVKSID